MNWPTIELACGTAILALSIITLLWVRNDPNAGYLMILGAFLAVAAFAGIVVGATLAIGGAWRVAGLTDPGIGRAIGAVAGILLAWACWPRSRRRPSD